MRRLWFWLLLLPLSAAAADKLSIAAAANLIYAVESLNAAFKQLEPGTEITVVTGASGSLVAQIQNAAPFDLFLSADLEFPEQLMKSGEAEIGTFTKFAVGRLVLWTTRPQLEIDSVEKVVRNPDVQKLAIANVQTAPYGKAAREALTNLGLWAVAESKIVFGENITETAQFVETGNADAGFVAMSLVVSPRLKGKGRWQEIPANLYSPLEHGAVITRHGATSGAARRYLVFLRRAEARAVLERFGYRVPHD